MKKHKENIRKNILNDTPSLFDDTIHEGIQEKPVRKFVKNKKSTSKKEMIRFYITEMTGLTEEEFNEHFFKGKKAKGKKEIKEAMIDAVKFKIKCDKMETLKNTENESQL